MPITENYNVTLVRMECSTCGTVFAMSNQKHERCLESGEEWYCPNGHKWHYGTTENKRLQDELTRTKQRAEQEAARLRSEAEWNRTQRKAAERREIGQKAAKTRLKNRIANGVCPCCNHSFENLQRHIKGMHPNFKAEK